MAYLEYGLAQGEGFIVITGEIGAGKTTLMRNLFRKLESENIVAAQIVNTHVDSDDILQLVAAAFGVAHEGVGKAVLLTRVEHFLRQCDRQGKRALLVVDEAQNLTPRAVEELRMLSNFQTAERPLLQTFLLGQPEFRKILLGSNMQQLLQRVTASYHLGPMDATETRAYIQHRLQMVGWRGDPTMSDDAYAAIHAYAEGIPRKINTLCDRLFLLGYLEELRAMTAVEVAQVIADIRQEFTVPHSQPQPELQSESQPDMPRASNVVPLMPVEPALTKSEGVDDRISRMERSISTALSAVEKLLSSLAPKNRS
jgi:putative secretion ATPase (PEP-CTERM system associated)